VLLVVALVVGPVPASAQEVGVELDVGMPQAAADQLDVGWGGQLRLSQGTPLPIGTAALEGAVDYYRFPMTESEETASLYRVVAGLRLGLDLPFAPTVFAHVGYGSLDARSLLIDASAEGLSWDVGLAADVLSSDDIGLGLHVAYKSISEYEQSEAAGGGTMGWLGIGLHGELGF
jgi:hypothetical protein